MANLRPNTLSLWERARVRASAARNAPSPQSSPRGRGTKNASLFFKSLGLALLITIFALFPATAAVAPAKIRLSQSNVGVSAAPLWIANNYGFFKKYSIELEPIYVRNSTIQVMALTTGEVQLSHTGGAPTLNAVASGHDLKIVATFTHDVYWDIVARPEVKSLEDLRGREIGVTNIGGTTWIGAILALEYYRLNPERDRIKLQALGDQTVLVQSLTSGRVDAILTDPSFTRELKKKGFRVLADLSRAKIPFASSGLVVSKSYLQQQPEIVESILRGLIEGTAFVYNPANQETVLRFFTERLKFNDTAAAKEALQDLDRIIARKPYPGLEGLRNIQRVLRYNPSVAKVKVEDLIDERIYRKLEDSGFIDNLFKFAKTR